jgi:short-subunit dehydrogenase
MVPGAKARQIGVNMKQNEKGTALITGASSGIGEVYADRLARRGYELILVARSTEQLEKLATHLRNETGRSVRVIVVDLTNKLDLKSIEDVLRGDPKIAIFVNNAGTAVEGDFLNADPDRLESMILLNVLAASRLAWSAVNGFVQRGKGTLINIGSVTALAPERLSGGYAGSKAYLLALTQRLNEEVAGKGVRVQVVMPGATRTAIWSKAGVDVASLPSVMSADEMVDAALAGLDQGELVTIPSRPDAADWEAYENARRSLLPNLSLRHPAARYTSATAKRVVA